MDISIYFEPLKISDYNLEDVDTDQQIGGLIRSYFEADKFPELGDVDIAIIGVNEDRKSVSNEGCAKGPDKIRKQLYKLFKGDFNPRIADLGNIKQGHEVKDTYYALSNVITNLLQNKTIPIILGGGQDLTYANYRAYESLGQVINILAIDPRFDLGKTEQGLDSQTYLNKIILHQPNFLFNYTNIGYQSYYVDPHSISLMKNLYFDVYRLGLIRENLDESEPLCRNADMITFDVSSIKQSEAPGHKSANPNGFYGEEACQIMRYAGMSDKLSSIGFYEYNPDFDLHNQSASLIAQMMWYFIEGFYNRKFDFPYKDKSDYIKYKV